MFLSTVYIGNDRGHSNRTRCIVEKCTVFQNWLAVYDYLGSENCNVNVCLYNVTTNVMVNEHCLL
jgi:hypothetical protein